MFNVEFFDIWNMQTWNEMLKSAHEWDDLSEANKKNLINQLRKLRLKGDYESFKDRPVDGNTTSGWEDLTTSRRVKLTKRCPMFQETLERVANKYDFWTPADVMLEFNKACDRAGIPWEQRELGRCLRNIPSFVREDIICDKMRTAGLDCSLPSASVNANEHVDIIYHCEGKSGNIKDIYIWSYLVTDKSLKNVKDKTVGGRSEGGAKISKGINFLAPFDNHKDKTSYLNWWIPSDVYINRLIKALRSSKTERLMWNDSKLKMVSTYGKFTYFVKK